MSLLMSGVFQVRPTGFITHQPAARSRILMNDQSSMPGALLESTPRHGEHPRSPAARDSFDHTPIIVHSHLRWDFVWQRPQQVCSRLAQNHRILFVEDPKHGSGPPRLEVSEPIPNVVRVVPVMAPGGTVDDDCERLVPLLEEALANHALIRDGFDSHVQWFYSPMTAPRLLHRFGAIGIVYDCMDELANFRFAPPDIVEREKRLLGATDVVFTGGLHLFESKSRLHCNVHFLGCGVDLDHFAKARDPATPASADITAMARPVLGYFGVIDERIDYVLLRQLAEHFPKASLAMVGPFAKIDPDRLPRLPTIHWLGQRPYDELPALTRGFDVCLMPFALNDATRYINPTKTLEYMAAGKPVVSTSIPDVISNFSSVVSVAHDRADFLRKVQRALRYRDPVRIQRGIESAAAAGWGVVVASMRARLFQALQGESLRGIGTPETAVTEVRP